MFDAPVNERDKWLVLSDGEVDPEILGATRSSLVVWGSLWPVSPEDTIEFHMSSVEGGTALRFTWYTALPPDERGIGLVRQKLNTALGQHLREWVDTKHLSGRRDVPVRLDRRRVPPDDP